ncbi:MAG: plastocyanin/azurin family copper-binding protein [Gemmatimonadota bacterium]
MRRIAAVLAVGSLVTGFSVASATRAAPEPKTIVVKMVDISETQFAFEPADVVANKGDIVQFVQQGPMPHNVAFKEGPAGSNLTPELVMGPYLTAPGQTYDLVIDDRFASGLHRFICTPHEAMGMKGTLTVN